MVIDLFFQKIREDVVKSSTLNAVISGRIYPQRVDLEENTSQTPAIYYSLVGGFPDQDNYKSDVFVMETMFISTKSVDECFKMYDLFNELINLKSYKETGSNRSFRIREDSKPLDASGVFGNNIYYIYSNTYSVHTIG